MSMYLNEVNLRGRLGRDPEIRTFDSGDRVANLSLATTQTWKDKQTGERKEATEWHRVVVWGKLVDVVEKFLRKGLLISVRGMLVTRKWQDQSGQDRYSTEIVLRGYDAKLDILEFEGGSGGREEGQRKKRDELAPGPDDDRSTYGGEEGGEPAGAFDDEIPFAPQML